ncbi:condensation domain-containing protein, partial [Nocardiopsis sp. NRRL B-16309]|uniref:condensation domain-containing protein n=1 Tax=Nocardiopsis sp. NRRL B-16309 TaxID=1519494 RepID=UPI0006C2CCD2
VFRAKQHGLHLTVKQLFQHQTIAELAPVTEQRQHVRATAEQGTVTGPTQLTPIQHWFFDQDFAHPDHVNQSLLIEADTDLTPQQWQHIVRALLHHHDTLRTRFLREGDHWHAEITDVPHTLPWQEHDLSAHPPTEHDDHVQRIADQIQSSIDISTAPLLRAALFTGSRAPGRGSDTGSGLEGVERENRLLLVAHHLVVDVVSWRIILEDL